VAITSWSYVLPPSSLGFSNEAADFTVVFYFSHFEQGIAWGAAGRYAPRRWQFDSGKNRGRSTSVHLWWPQLQAASMPIA